MWTMSQPASARAIAAVRPMPRVVPVTQATWPSRRKLSSTPGIGRGYHRARGPALARARDLARAGARRRRADGRRLARRSARAARRRPARLCLSRGRRRARRAARVGLAAARRRAGVRRARPGSMPRASSRRTSPCSAIRATPTTASTRWRARATCVVSLGGRDAGRVDPRRWCSSRPTSRRASTSRRPTSGTICSSRARPSRPSPYLGTAVWFSARIGGELHPDVAWTYRFPIPQMPRIAGLLAFRDELVREL